MTKRTGKQNEKQNVIAYSQVEARPNGNDEYVIGIWRIWPNGQQELHRILAVVPTPDKDPAGIARAKEIAKFLASVK